MESKRQAAITPTTAKTPATAPVFWRNLGKGSQMADLFKVTPLTSWIGLLQLDLRKRSSK